MSENDLARNIEKISAEVKESGVTLCAVIKNRTNEEIAFALEHGIKTVGENRVQELLYHYDTLKSHNADVHFIGKLQTNKVKYIVDKVSVIESLDSVKLASEIEKQAAKLEKKIDVLIEVNIGREEQKSGVLPEDLPAFIDEISRFGHLCPRGLMTVAPKCENISDYDVYFEQMRVLTRDVFGARFANAGRPVLSMGMSGNYAEAIKFGSTEVRIGTGLFGERPKNVQIP